MSYSLRRLSGSDERTYSVISAAGGRFYSAFTEPTFHAAKTGGFLSQLRENHT